MSLLFNHKRKAFIVQYFEEEKLWMPYDNSFLLTVEETNELIAGLQEYIKHGNMIDEYNKERQKEIEENNKQYLSREVQQPKPRKPQNGFVYIVKFKDYYKIGRTKNIQSRLGEYTKLPEPPIILVCKEVSDYAAVEEKLHTIFEKKRVRGEWFNLSATDIQRAEKILKHKIPSPTPW